MSLDRTAIPRNVLDRLLEVERRLDDLEGFAALPVADPEGGDTTYVSIVQEVEIGEGPGTDVTGTSPNQTVGLAGDSILLYDSGGAPVAEFAATGAGLASALAAMSAGDVAELPAGTISGGPWTVANGTVRGIGFSSVVSGTITVSSGATLEYLGVNGNVTNNGGTIWGVRITVTTGTGLTQTFGAAAFTTIDRVSAPFGLNVSGGYLYWVNVRHVNPTGGSVGAFIDGSGGGEIVCHDCRFAGWHGAIVKTALHLKGCSFESSAGDALIHDTGTALLTNCTFRTDDQGGRALNITSAGLTMIDCNWSNRSGTAEIGLASISYGYGDRGAFDDTGNPSLHSSSLRDATYGYHTPLSTYSRMVAPTVNDDNGDGYAPGSRWLDVTHDVLYECVDATTGAAIWQRIIDGDDFLDKATYDSDDDGTVDDADHAANADHASAADTVPWAGVTDTPLMGYSRVLFAQTVHRTVANTTDPTNLLYAGRGTKTVVAGTLEQGDTIRVTLSGDLTDTGTPSPTITLQLGATVIATVTPTLTGVTAVQWWLNAIITVTASGAGGEAHASGILFYDNGAIIQFSGDDSVDTTAALEVGVVWEWDVANASNSIESHHGMVEVLPALGLAPAAPTDLTAVEA